MILMNSELPISIKASSSLSTSFIKLASILIKHEAHFNFQTLAAGWYEDENNILQIKFIVLSHQEFTKQFNIENLGKRTEIADDVLSYYDNAKNKVTCFVAITESESALLLTEQKLLPSYTKTKLAKVLNFIAAEHHKTLL